MPRHTSPFRHDADYAIRRYAPATQPYAYHADAYDIADAVNVVK